MNQKLNKNEIIEILDYRKKGLSFAKIAKIFKVHRQTIFLVCKKNKSYFED